MFLRSVFSIFCFFTFMALVKAAEIEQIRSNPNCLRPLPEELPVYREDFTVEGWYMSFATMKSKYEKIYQGGKRLLGRAFFGESQQKILLPTARGFHAGKAGLIELKPEFIESIQSHIEKALRLGYVDYVFFPDMGHSHMLIPQKKFKEVYDDIDEQRLFYQKAFSDPDIKFLYHTAEQLDMVDQKTKVIRNDLKLIFRYATRNLLAENNKLQKLDILHSKEGYNSVSKVDGFRYWYGFNITASKNGCFSYQHQGKTYYFDMSLQDFPKDPSAPDYDEGE